MAKISVNWIYKNENNKLKGPYSTKEILELIDNGVIEGDEEISRYPGNQWTSVSKISEFYERIINQIENSQKKEIKIDQTNHAKDKQLRDQMHGQSKIGSKFDGKTENTEKNEIAETVIIPYSQIGLNRPENGINTSSSKLKNSDGEVQSDVINLENINHERFKEIKNIARWPVFGVLIIGSLLLVYFGIFYESDEYLKNKLSLIEPKASKNTLTEDQVNQRVQHSLVLIGSDNVESYLEAQNILVSTIENSLKNLKARMILCLVYKELWPYAKQDSQDQKVIASFTRKTRSLNKIDASGIICESVKLFTEARYQESLGVVDSILEKEFSNFILYQIKGEILEIENETLIAESFYQKAKELSGRWVKPLFYQALINLKLKEFAKADQYFLQILQLNKKHKATYFGLGILEYLRNQKDKAFNYFISGMAISALMDNNLESQGLEYLSEIYLIKGDKYKARDIANINLKKNPSRKQAQELCVRLGGCDKISMSNAGPQEELMWNCQKFLRQKEFIQAQAECKAAFELNPKNSQAALKAAESLWGLGQGSEAIDWINKSIKANPQFIEGYIKKAEYSGERYEFLEAERSLLQAEFLSRGNFEVQKGFAQLAYKKKDYLGVIKLIQKALKSFDADVGSIILYSSAARELARLSQVTNKKEQEERDKYTQDAYSFALRAVELDSTNIKAQVNFAKTIYLRQGIDSGSDYFNELIKKFPTLYDYRIALAEIYMDEGRYKQAKEVLENAVSINDQLKKAHLNLGKCYYQLGFIDKSLGSFLKASYLDPSDAEPIFEIAKIYLETSNLNEAKTQLERVLKINERFPRAHFLLGKVFLQNGNFFEAEKNAELEKKLYPKLVDSYILVADIKYASKNYSECASEYAKATNAGAQPVYIYVKASRCYRLAGQLDMAQGFLDIASERENGFEDIYKEQGALFESRGDRTAAIKAYCKYLELSPNSKDKGEFLNQVRFLGGTCDE